MNIVTFEPYEKVASVWKYTEKIVYIAGFQSRDVFSARVVNSKWKHKYLSWVLTLCLVARMFNLTKFPYFHKAPSDNMCKVDRQALSNVKVLSETLLYEH